jgi:decaprenylphospho-beta-D-erythro-pentofuranosid-2-ulose 2-reductase
MRDGVGRVQTVLVIGGTSDIGLASAEALLGEVGGTLILAGRQSDALDGAAERMARDRRTVLTLPYDAGFSGEAVGKLLRRAAAVGGDLDVVLVCVGVLGEQTRLDNDTAATEESLRVNILAPAIATHAAAVLLAQQGHGVVVVLSSTAALRPRREILTYSAAKAGLDSYARGLADVFAGSGARVMVVRPGQVRTRMTAGLPDVPFTVDASDVAEAIRRGVLSGTQVVVYVPAVLRFVMTALRALPGPVFRRLMANRAPGPTTRARPRAPDTNAPPKHAADAVPADTDDPS